MRPQGPQTAQRSITRVAGRTRNLERRFEPGSGMIWAVYAANVTVAADESATAFTFDGNLEAGTELFDYAGGGDSPTPLADGIYVITLDYHSNFSVAGKKGFATITAVGVSPAFSVAGQMPLDESAFSLPSMALSPSWPLTTARTVQVLLGQDDSATHVFGTVVTVIKLS